MRTRIRTPEPTLADVMRDQFSSRDETLLKLYGHINKIMGQVTTLSRSVAQLEARLRKLEPRPPAEKPAVERRPKRVAMTFQESDQ